MDVALDSPARARANPIEHVGSILLTAMVLAAVAVVPLLLNLGSIEDTYYSAKARALTILAPLLVLSLLGSSGVSELRRRFMLWPLMAFVGAAGLATAFSVNAARSVLGAPQRDEGLLALLAYAAICAGTVVVVARGGLRVWHAAVLTCGTVVAAYGVAQYFGWEWLIRDPVRVFWWRPFSTSGNPNFLGAYMVLMGPLAVAALLTARRKIVAGLSLGALAMTVLAALCTYSRAAWLGLAIAALMFVPTLRTRRVAGAHTRETRRRLLAAIALGAVLTILFFLPSSPLAIPRADWSAAQRAGTAFDPMDPQAGLRQRLYLWGHTLSLLRHRLLTGYGPETFSLVFPQGWDAERYQAIGGPVGIDKAHNDTLDLAMSMGVLGVAAFWWVFVSAVRRGVETLGARDAQHLLAAACLAAMAGYWIDVQWHFSVVSVAPVFWSVIGAVSGIVPRSEGAR